MAHSNAPKSSVKTKRPYRLWVSLTVLTLVLSLTALLLVGGLFRQKTKVRLAQRGLEANMSVQLERLETEMARMRDEQLGARKRVDDLLIQAGEYRHAAALSEIEYVLRLAQQTITFEQDADKALALVQAAKTALSGMSDVHAGVALQSLDRLRESLLVVREKGPERLLKQLQAVSAHMASLPLPLPLLLTEPNQKKETAKTESSSGVSELVPAGKWDRVLFYTKKVLSQMVVVRRSEAMLRSPLPPDEQQQFLENMQMLLQRAEWAIWVNRPAVYEAHVRMVQTWVQRYLNPHHPEAQQVMAEVQALPVRYEPVSWPNTQEALRAVQALFDVVGAKKA